MKVTSNKQKRHFTIWLNGLKYRTTQMTKSEFNDAQYFTHNDWANFIRRAEVIRL